MIGLTSRAGHRRDDGRRDEEPWRSIESGMIETLCNHIELVWLGEGIQHRPPTLTLF